MRSKTLQNLLSLQGKIPRYVKEEARILYYEFGLELSDIEYIIYLRTKRD